jgi:hypothetical protein
MWSIRSDLSDADKFQLRYHGEVPQTREYPEKGFDSGRHYGVVAQEVEAVIAEAVREGPDGEKEVAYSEIIPVLIESLGELKAENESLKQRIAAIEANLR